jgi:hypothetical protein
MLVTVHPYVPPKHIFFTLRVVLTSSPPAQAAANTAMESGCALVGNRDIDAMIPVILSCIRNPAEVQDCVHKLASTTFVQQVHWSVCVCEICVCVCGGMIQVLTITLPTLP